MVIRSSEVVSPMEMQQVRYFLALASKLNFTRAAEECNVTQPALTRAIQSLEAELGGELVRRERQHTHLTELGHRMLPLLRQCYEAAVSAKSLASAVRSHDVASLSIAVANSVNLDLFAGPLAELLKACPGVRLKVRRGSPAAILEALKEGGAELAVAGPLDSAWDRIDCWPLFEEDIELAVNTGHALARRNTAEIELADVTGEPRVGGAGWEPDGDAMRQGGAPEIATHEVENDRDMLTLVEANAGVGFMPASAPQSPNVRRLKLKDAAISRAVGVYGVAGRQRSTVGTMLLNMLRAMDWSSFGVREPA